MIPLIVNLFGGPGSGKSTMAAGLFAELKESGISTELVTEYAKDKTWEEAYNVLNNQLYVFAKQHHRIWRVANKVDVIITDSPLFLSLVYSPYEDNDILSNLVMHEIHKYSSLDVFLKRVKPYSGIGRSQTEDEAKAIDEKIQRIYRAYNSTFDLVVDGDRSSRSLIINNILNRLK
jgi:tRNA uridine 5-carbamoylmethylation protein Kti12